MRGSLFNYEVIRNLNDLEILIYNYAVSHPQRAAHMTNRELSKELSVFSTSILRFCAKLDCDGYSEFKYRLKENIASRNELPGNEDISFLQDFFRKAEENELNGLLDQAAEMILEREQIVCIGLGTSGILGEYAARYFSNLGILTSHISDPFYPVLGDDFSGMAVIAFSVSGEQRTLHKQISAFRQGGAKIISITNTKQCTLAKLSDLNISYYVPMTVLPGLYNVTSQVPVLYIVESLVHKIQKGKLTG